METKKDELTVLIYNGIYSGKHLKIILSQKPLSKRNISSD